jgi:adhesin HecA-like repeat protein
VRKLSFLLLVAALLIPAASFAKAPPPKKPKSAQQALIAKNSAQMCKALRSVNPALFKKTWGTNANRSNAYGKCVSAHARAKHVTKPTFTLRSIALNNAGTVSSAGAGTLNASGKITGFFGGTFTSSFTFDLASATPNGPSSFCYSATGTVTLTLPGLGTLTKQETGKVCEVGPTGANVPHTFTGTFTISGGTGVFSNATGSGTANFSQQPGPTTAQGGTFTGSESFDTLTIHL